MTLACPYCGVPADLPEWMFEGRRRMFPQERAIFDMLWRRHPGWATRKELEEAIICSGRPLTGMSFGQGISRLRKAWPGRVEVELDRSVYVRNPRWNNDPDNNPIYLRKVSYRLRIPEWNRALKT